MNPVRRAACTSLVIAALGAGCAQPPSPPPASPELTIEARRAMQTRIVGAPMDPVFAATIGVLQDMGWSLDSVDRTSGLIRATTAKRLEAFGPEDERAFDLRQRERTAQQRADVAKKWSRWKELVIHVEPWGAGRTRERIVMNLRGTLPATSYEERQGAGFMRRGRDVMINAPATEQSVEVAVPEAYRDIFDRIATAVRQRLEAAQPAP